MGFGLEKKRALVIAAIVCVAVLCAGCAGSQPHAEEPTDTGWVTRGIFNGPLYQPFRAGYDSATVAPEFAGLIRKLSDSVDVTIFFGPWCSDSKREVPRFLKLADSTGFQKSRIRFYALDRTKKSKDGLTDTFGIERVPTFIFLKDAKEIGRITESPRTTMEADVLTILAGAGKQ